MSTLFKSKLTPNFSVKIMFEVWTPLCLVALAILILGCQYVSKPIACHTPAQFTAAHTEYANKVCWGSSLYLPFEEPSAPSALKKIEMASQVSFYIPFILLAQAALLCLPRLVWSCLCQHPGIPLNTLTGAAAVCQTTKDSESYKNTVLFLGRRLAHHLQSCKTGPSEFLTLCNAFLSIAYFLVGLLRFAVSIACLFMSSMILGDSWDLAAVFTGNMTLHSEHLPKVSLCDYEIRQAGRVHSYVVQCTLPNNGIYLIINILLYVWYSFLIATTLCTAVSYLVRSVLVPCLSGGSVTGALVSSGRQPGSVKGFVDFLGRDGLLIAELVEENSNSQVAAEMLGHTWDCFSGNSLAGATEMMVLPHETEDHQVHGEESKSVYPKLA